MVGADVLDELERYNNELHPNQQLLGVDSLDDGNYDFEILRAEFDRTPEQRSLVVRATLKILSGPTEKNAAAGLVLERLWFLDKLTNAERFAGDLKSLGFDVDQWKPPARPFSQEVARAVPRLQGLRFRARKSTRRDGEKVYHNLNLVGAVKNGGPGSPPSAPPPAPRPAPQAPPAGPPPVPPVATAMREPEDEIPF